MGAINGVIKGVSLLHGNVDGVGIRKAYLISCEFPAYTGASDTATITGVGAAITTATKTGRTLTLRGGLPVQAGFDTAGQAVYATGTAVQAMTVSSDDLTGNLSNAAGAELTATTGASQGVMIVAIVDES